MHFVLLVGVVYFLFFLMYQKTRIAATPKFDERGGLSSSFVTDDQNWSYLEASFSSATPNTLLERITGIRIGFRCDPLIECAAKNLADKFIDDDGKIYYGTSLQLGAAGVGAAFLRLADAERHARTARRSSARWTADLIVTPDRRW